MAVAGRSRISNVIAFIGDAGPFDYYLSYWPPARIIDPGYNASKPSRFVYQMSLNTSPYVRTRSLQGIFGRVRSVAEEAGAVVEIDRAIQPGPANDRGRTLDVDRRD